jgi:hypothetical protein
MNRLKKLNVTAILLLISQMTNAQHVYPAAITNNGILFGKYRTANGATNSLPDTISLEDAKNIIAINAIHIDKEQKLYRIKVADYQMTIFEKGDTTTIKNNSEMLSQVMKERLSKIKSGAKLFFEGIRTEFPSGESRSVIILSFTVI